MPEQVQYDTRNRIRVQPGDVDIGHIKGPFLVPERSSWIQHHNMFLLHEEKDFSTPAVYFVKPFPPEDLSDNEFVFRTLLKSLKIIDRIPSVEHSAKAFFKLSGWLDLILVEPKDGDGLECITLDDNQISSILCGYWAHLRASSIMTHNKIDGLVMDTTFKVIQLYDTTALVAVSYNMGIPVCVAFGYQELIELYNQFYVFFDKFYVNLRTYILESD
jgi:hypothetical protein